jgi:hypothetical protein
MYIDRMKKLIVLAAAVLTIVLAPAGRADNEMVAIKGEVVDLHCFLTRGAHGEDHAGCANACLSRDVPAGLLADDGTLYLLVNEKANSVKEKVAGKAGKKWTARGKVVERNGVKALQVTSID